MADDYVEAEPSPSNCNYCYALDCGIRIESTSSLIRGNTIVCKTAKIIVGRSADRKIVLQVEMQGRSRGAPAVTSYPLQDCRVHEQNVQKGSGGIEIPSRKLVIHVCNCAPRKLNVFLKTLRAKLDLMNVDNEGVRTPVGLARHRLLNGGLPDIFNKLSPLTVGEIRRIRRIRGVESPLAKSSSGNGRTPVRQNPTQTSPRGIKRSSGEATPKRETAITVRRSIPSDRVQLSAEQRNVVRAVVSGGQNVFFTGSAGTGKSLVLRRIIEMLPATTTVVTAATGVAACQLGGVTLHSFAGIGVGGTKEDCLRNAQAKKLVVRAWKSITHLIIDEISMVDADYFTCLEYVARKIRGGEPRPFGGIQLVITGDFLQLPPVAPNGQRPKFCFESTAWRASVTTTILLREVRRQNDDTFIKILQEIRVGNCPSWATSALKATQNRELAEGVVPTRLCTHTADAEKLNQHSLRQLDTMAKVFEAEDSEPISDQSGGLIPRRLVLKTMAQVMLTKNLDLSRGLSNGARGVVEAFAPSGFPLVRFVACSEAPIELRPVRFHMRSSVTSEQTAIRRQLPLQLAWAISIHKSQGLTLDAVEMSLQRVFAEGQAYVALSRARSLDALQINGFEPECVKANQKVVRFYDSLRDCEAGTETDDMTAFIIRKRSRPSV